MNGRPATLSALWVGLTVSKVSFEEDGLYREKRLKTKTGMAPDYLESTKKTFSQ